ASGVVPQISLIMGPCAGGAVYSPAITDFIVMTKDTSYMFITGPEVIKTVTHEEVTKDDLGGALAHNQKSGVAHFAAENEQSSMVLTRELLSYLPSNNAEDPPVIPCDDDPFRADESLRTIVPPNPTKPYDTKAVVRSAPTRPAKQKTTYRHQGGARRGRRPPSLVRRPAALPRKLLGVVRPPQRTT